MMDGELMLQGFATIVEREDGAVGKGDDEMADNRHCGETAATAVDGEALATVVPTERDA